MATDPERSPLEGLGTPRQGAHRPGGSHAGGLLASAVAVVAVVGLLIGLYTAFGRPGDGRTSVAQGESRGHAAASVPAAAPETLASSDTPSATAAASASPTSVATASVDAHPTPSTSARARSTSPSASATSVSAPRTLPVVVLNQSHVAGRAARTAAQIRSLGWSVAAVGNFRGQVASTTVYYPPGGLAAAEGLAARLGVSRVRAAFPGVSQTALTLVLV